VVVPEGTVTLAGTVATAVFPLDSVTNAPLAGAISDRCTVPVTEFPPITGDVLSVMLATVGTGCTRSAAETVTPLYVDETVAVVVDATANVGTVNAAELAPADTDILAGVGVAIAVLLLVTGMVTAVGDASEKPTEQLGTVSPPTTS
jgi:hypothetical protein